MFRCALTKKLSKPGEPMIKIVVETRQTVYVNKDAEGTEHISHGHEIVKEIGVTQEGFELWKASF